MGRHPGTARFHLQARRAGNVHLESALLCREVRASQPRFSLTRRAISRIPHPQRSLLRGRSGLTLVADAVPGSLIIGADVVRGAGAAAVLCGGTGRTLRVVTRVTRSLPVTTLDAHGKV